MKRSILAVSAGYISIAGLNIFTRAIISLYFRVDLNLSGISYLPSTGWVVAICALYPVFGLFAGLLTSTLSKNNYSTEILSLILLLAAVGLFDFSLLNHTEPLWFLAAAPMLKIAGVWGGYKIKLSQDRELGKN